jgi:hypothetical protein
MSFLRSETCAGVLLAFALAACRGGLFRHLGAEARP